MNSVFRPDNMKERELMHFVLMADASKTILQSN
jgi:hypothetical protein